MEGTHPAPGDKRHAPFGAEWASALGLAVVVAIAYFLAARLSLALRAEPGVAFFWPAAGIAVGTLLAWGPGARLPVSAAVILATALSNFMIGRNPWLAAVFGVVNAGQALLTAWLIERAFGSAFKLESVAQVLGLLVASAIGAALAAACAAVAVSLVGAAAPILDVWRLWFASCLLGIITAAPLLIGIGQSVRDPPPPRELIEGAAGLVTLAVLSVYVLSLPAGFWATALPVAIVFPLLLWIVVRCRPVFAAAAAFVVALAVIWSTTFNMGHFGNASVPLADRVLAAQTVVLVAALLALVFAALFAERRQSEAALKQSTERLQLALDGAALGTFSAEIATGHLVCDARAADMHGHTSLPKTLREGRRFIVPEDLPRIDAGYAEAQRTGCACKAEYRIVRPPDSPHAGEVRWVSFEGSIVRNALGRPVRLIGITHDITERKRADAHQLALNAELDHRVKNVLATVNAIIAQTQKASGSPADFAAALDHRIKSLARTHELLSQSRWQGVSLGRIVQLELAPYAASNAEIGGPRVTLKAEATHAVATVVHELTTNAAKYGAFSNGSGRVLLRWWWLQNGSDDPLTIEWQEIGGPPVLAPSHCGYGTSIIRELIPFELGGRVKLAFPSEGTRCRLEIPGKWVSGGPPLSDDTPGLRLA